MIACASAGRHCLLSLQTYLDGMRPVLDIDGDGNFDAQTDGLLVSRYLFGLRGAALLQGVVFSITATRTTAVDIEAFLAAMTP